MTNSTNLPTKFVPQNLVPLLPNRCTYSLNKKLPNQMKHACMLISYSFTPRDSPSRHEFYTSPRTKRHSWRIVHVDRSDDDRPFDVDRLRGGARWRNDTILSAVLRRFLRVNSIHLCANCFDMCPHCGLSLGLVDETGRADTRVAATYSIFRLATTCGSYSPTSKRSRKEKKAEQKGNETKRWTIELIVLKKRTRRRGVDGERRTREDDSIFWLDDVTVCLCVYWI